MSLLPCRQLLLILLFFKSSLTFLLFLSFTTSIPQLLVHFSGPFSFSHLESQGSILFFSWRHRFEGSLLTHVTASFRLRALLSCRNFSSFSENVSPSGAAAPSQFRSFMGAPFQASEALFWQVTSWSHDFPSSTNGPFHHGLLSSSPCLLSSAMLLLPFSPQCVRLHSTQILAASSFQNASACSSLIQSLGVLPIGLLRFFPKVWPFPGLHLLFFWFWLLHQVVLFEACWLLLHSLLEVGLLANFMRWWCEVCWPLTPTSEASAPFSARI